MILYGLPHCAHGPVLPAHVGVRDGTGEIEVMLAAFDVAPTDLTPTYELWVGRRERWLHSMGEQFAGDRTAVT